MTTASSANSLGRKDGNVLFFFFGSLFFVFGHQLPAFLNDHCEHELWKASLHDIADSLILLFHIFPITLFLINCQSYIKYLYKSNPLHV